MDVVLSQVTVIEKLGKLVIKKISNAKIFHIKNLFRIMFILNAPSIFIYYWAINSYIRSIKTRSVAATVRKFESKIKSTI